MMSAEESIGLIIGATEGLWMMSESDYPFEPFIIETPIAEPFTVETLRAFLALPAETPVAEVDLNRFFRNLEKTYEGATFDQIATANRFTNLKVVLQTVLAAPMVYKIGQIEIEAYLIGRTESGYYGGLKTMLIET